MSADVWDDGERLKTLQEQGVTRAEAAEALDVPYETLDRHWNKIAYAGIQGDVRREVILLCSLRGRSWFRSKEIAEALDVSPQKVGQVLGKLSDEWDPLEQGETADTGRWWFNRNGGDPR